MTEPSTENLDLRITRLENSLEKLEKKIDALLAVWEQSKGVLKFLKLVFYVSAPLVGLLVWLKEHVKL